VGTRSIKVDPNSVFVTGNSNGGFMTSYLGLESIRNERRQRRQLMWINAIAPVSGHLLDPKIYGKLISDNEPSTASLPILLIHSAADNTVRSGGCCEVQKCCCNIERPECTSTEEIFGFWKKINKCDPEKEDIISLEAIRKSIATGTSYPVSCRSALGCAANTTFCMIEDADHSMFLCTSILQFHILTY
jgi:poly(3-hydroxybutyrate) depolymerase